MSPREAMWNFFEAIDEKFLEQFGFRIKDTTFLKIEEYLHRPKDSSSLAVTRILFGLAMLFDIPDERGGASMERRWGGKVCHFSLLPFIKAEPMPHMALIYAALWLGAAGIMLGYKYSLSSITFTTCYWYLLLSDKSFWNNHSYLFGLVALLLTFTRANCYWSLDTYLNPSQKKATVPYWNYFILKYQFFILYFMAGLKKGTAEWLTGYSVQKLSEHWVFDSFKFLLTVPQIDCLIVHWFIFVFDLTVAVWMMWSRTRHFAMVFCAMFHLMNSRLFRIGMFPWVCLATMPLFYPFDWPKTLLEYFHEKLRNIKHSIGRCLAYLNCCKRKTKEDLNERSKEFDLKNDKPDDSDYQAYDEMKEERPKISEDPMVYVDYIREYMSENCKDDLEIDTDIEAKADVLTEVPNDKPKKIEKAKKITTRQKLTTYMILFHVVTQLFLPYSHFITKGYNNWTNGLYGYSWDMMVHTWDTQSIIVKVVDNDNQQEFYIDPSVYTLNDRWSRHGDMVYQYAHCLKDILLKERNTFENWIISENFSIYIDVWCSMNGRFTQRLFDPKIDMLKASWTPFKEVPYLMPLLDEAIHWRSTLEKIKEDTHKWRNDTDVIFLADFPGYEQEKYIPLELENITLTVLEGVIGYEKETTTSQPGSCHQLNKGDHTRVDSGLFHKILVTGTKPAYYMYNFTNSTETESEDVKMKPKLPIFTELYKRFKGMFIFGSVVINSFYRILFDCNGKC